jgi:hypothetical protein
MAGQTPVRRPSPRNLAVAPIVAMPEPPVSPPVRAHATNGRAATGTGTGSDIDNETSPSPRSAGVRAVAAASWANPWSTSTVVPESTTPNLFPQPRIRPHVGTQLNTNPHDPVGSPFRPSASPTVRVLLRRLPLTTTEESIRLMNIWSTELVDFEVLPREQSYDDGFLTALLRFRTIKGAEKSKDMLDGRANASNDADMIVEILPASPLSGLWSATEPIPKAVPAISRPSVRHNMQQPGVISPHSRSAQTELPNPANAGTLYQDIFTRQSPVGPYATEVPRSGAVGKSLINDNAGDDDDNLLNNVGAYANLHQQNLAPYNGTSEQRRATMPQVPTDSFGRMSLNTNQPSSMPQSHYMGYAPAHGSRNGNGAGPGYSNVPRAHLNPPANPSDLHAPCNTLYVGNLPSDTIEEELKTIFSKQRGYKRMCFRAKQNGPMCFVEFEDISCSTRAMDILYGYLLSNSTRGGLRISYSKNPLGVRSPQNTSSTANAMVNGHANGYHRVGRAPPGLPATPPGLGQGRNGYNGHVSPGFINSGPYWNPGPHSIGNGMYGVPHSSFTGTRW